VGKKWYVPKNRATELPEAERIHGMRVILENVSTNRATLYELNTEGERFTVEKEDEGIEREVYTRWEKKKIESIVLRFTPNRKRGSEAQKLREIEFRTRESPSGETAVYDLVIPYRRAKEWHFLSKKKRRAVRMDLSPELEEGYRVNLMAANEFTRNLGVPIELISAKLGASYHREAIIYPLPNTTEKIVEIPTGDNNRTSLCIALRLVEKEEDPKRQAAYAAALAISRTGGMLGPQAWQRLADETGQTIKLYTKRVNGMRRGEEVLGLEEEATCTPADGEPHPVEYIAVSGKQYNLMIPAREFERIEEYMLGRQVRDGLPTF
jgi:hypothetical protein